MKIKIFLSALMLIAITLISCGKSEVQKPDFDANQFVEQVQKNVIASHTGDALYDQNFDLTTAELEEILTLENQHLNIWSDEELKNALNTSKNSHERYRLLAEKIPLHLRNNEGSTFETVVIRSGKSPLYDSSPDIVAQTIANFGNTVGVHSSLNFWRPTFPNDNGSVTAFDVTRSILAANQSSFLDNAVEYDPTSVEWGFEVSGGNWLIGATIVAYNAAGVPTFYEYGLNSPLGPLVWNPTLDSDNDDVIQGPLPNGIVSISANGLTPPVPGI